MSVESNQSGELSAPHPFDPDEKIHGDDGGKCSNPNSVYPFVRIEVSESVTWRVREDELL